MTIDEAQTMLNARAKCIEKVCRGIYEDCNKENCDNCDLCYAQGTNGEQKELMLQCVEWLEELKSYRASVFSGYMTQRMLKEEYNKAIDDFVKALQEKIEKDLANPDLALECKKCGIWKNYDIKEMAEKLKAGVSGERD